MIKFPIYAVIFLMACHAQADITHKDSTGTPVLALQASWMDALQQKKCGKGYSRECQNFTQQVTTVKQLAESIHKQAVQNAQFDKYPNNATIHVQLSKEAQQAIINCARDLKSDTCKLLFQQAIVLMDACKQIQG